MEQLKYILEFLSKSKYAVGIQTLVLGFTALIISIYTYLTWKLWRESKIQTDLAQTPYLLLRFDDEKNCWFIKNIGSSVATKIEIKGPKIFVAENNEKTCLEIKFECIEILEPQEEKKVPHKAFENGKLVGCDFLVYSFLGEKARFDINYKNIFGQKFYFIIFINKNEYRIEKFGRK